jgi:hypothetical protein
MLRGPVGEQQAVTGAVGAAGAGVRNALLLASSSYSFERLECSECL